MTTSPSPPEDRPDHVTLAFRAIGFCVLFGTAIMTAFLLANRLLVKGVPQGATPSFDQPAALVLVFGVMFTLMVPAAAAWVILAPLGSAYRRGGLAMVSGLGSLLLSALTVPINQLVGTRGLASLLGLALVGSLVMWRRVTRWSLGS